MKLLSPGFRRAIRSLFYLAGMLTLAGVMLTFAAHPARAETGIFYVTPRGAGDRSGLSWDNAAADLKAVIDGAIPGRDDTIQIWVAAGVYTPGGTAFSDSFDLKNQLEIYGGFRGDETDLSQRNPSANVTILSGDVDSNDSNPDDNFIAESWDDIIGTNTATIVNAASVDTSAVLDGFTITAGDTTGSGAGIYIFDGSPTLRNLIVSGNRAGSSTGGGFGGGLNILSGGDPRLTNVAFVGNRAEGGSGGGMYAGSGSPSLDGVRFLRNQAALSGGGLASNGGDPLLTDVQFIENQALSGGGMSSSDSNAQLTHVIFEGNQATAAGGMSNSRGAPVLQQVQFIGNRATSGSGGGLSDRASALVLINGSFVGNVAGSEGGGLFNIISTPTLTNVTFASNQALNGGGIASTGSSGSVTTVQNSILWGNTADDNGAHIYNTGTAETRLRFSSIEGGITGPGVFNNIDATTTNGGGNLDADPRFMRAPDDGGDGFTDNAATAEDERANDDYGDLRIQPGSPLIDVGDNSLDPNPNTSPPDSMEDIERDLAGEPRIIDGNLDDTSIVDMGAYEASPGSVYLPLVSR